MFPRSLMPICSQVIRLLSVARSSGIQLCRTNASFTQGAAALRSKKAKSNRSEPVYFSDAKVVRTIGGKGGDGCISFLQLWCNERAGPDGGDGGNGGHIIFQASRDVRNFNHLTSLLRAEEGVPGAAQECHGKNAKHSVIKVPLGTVIRDGGGRIVGDLNEPELMFVAARGGVGGKGNRFFTTSAENSPKVCEYGPPGEDTSYTLELRSMADVGFIGLPNAGKSTLLNAITRARPKVAPYAFTTIRPHLGIVQYADLTQLAVADLPGLIAGSHRNRGLGIQFLKHAERCAVLLFVLDVSAAQPWTDYDQLMFELRQFSVRLAQRPQLVAANKMDQPGAQANIKELRRRLEPVAVPVIEISAKMGTNLAQLLTVMRAHCEQHSPKMAVPA